MDDTTRLPLPTSTSGFKLSRRSMIIGTLAGGLAIGIGWVATPISMLPRARRLASRAGETMLGIWVRIGNDDSITAIVPHQDMGQGAQTAVAMMLAEELDAEWAHIRVEQAPPDSAFANGAQVRVVVTFDEGLHLHIPEFLDVPFQAAADKTAQAAGMQMTVGSLSIRSTGVHLMRPTGAAARWMLRKAAATAWNVPLEEVETNASVLLHPASKRSARYGEMAEAAARFEPPADLPLKPKNAYRIVGKTTPRLDLPPKVDGTAQYPHDVRLPGMLYAAVRHCPVIGGKLLDCDPASALAMRGVSKVIKGPDTLIVIADNTWRARKAAAALNPRWEDGKLGGVSSAQVLATMAQTVRGDGGFDTDHKAGDVDAALAAAGARKIEAMYRVPYLVHAQMAPFASVGQFKDGKLTLWISSQNPLAARREVAKHAGLSVEDVTLHNLTMGGGFGRGTIHDYVLDAVDAAMQSGGVPVQTSWSREEDMTHGAYRQGSVAKLEGAVDDKGTITAIRHTYCERRPNMGTASAIFYRVPNFHVRHINGLNPMRWQFMRSVDNAVQAFFNESFIDELAHAAGQDPLAFRLAQCEERGKAVLERVGEISNWGKALPPGRARGVALRDGFGTPAAQVAEVSVDEDGRVRVHALYSVADPGLAINPGNLVAQIQGAVNFGLSATLFGEITFENGRVNQQNFPDYNMVRMADAPRQVVSLVESGTHIGGGGEVGTPPVAPAVCNAVFALTGVRIRELPLRHFNLRTGARMANA